MNKCGLLLLFVLVFASGLFAQVPPEFFDDKTRVIFSRTYANYAWEHVDQGIVVCSDGNVYRYNKSKEELSLAMHEAKPETMAALKSSFGKSLKLFKTIASEKVAEMTALVDEVKTFSYSEKTSNGRDMGCVLWLSYQSEADSGRFATIKLKEDGDFVENSLSPSAQVIVKWLDELSK